VPGGAEDLFGMGEGVAPGPVAASAALGEQALEPAQDGGVLKADAGDQGGQEFFVSLYAAFEIGSFAGVHIHILRVNA
jgi:hypothetical protein